jgi:hypothetical protein
MAHQPHSAVTMKSEVSFDQSVDEQHGIGNLEAQLDEAADTQKFHANHDQGPYKTQQTVQFFGQPVNNLPVPPKLVSSEQFPDWKNKIKNDAGMNNGSELLLHRATASWKLAQQENPKGPNDPLLGFAYRRMHSKFVAALSSAVEQVIPDVTALTDAIVTRKSSGNSEDILDNALIPAELNAYELFVEICNQFEQKTIIAALPIFRKMIGLQHHENDPSSKLFTDYDQLNIQLIKAVGDGKPKPGQILAEQMKLLLLLNALPESMELEKKMLQEKDNLTVQDIPLAILRRYDGKQRYIRPRVQQRQESAHSFTQSTTQNQIPMYTSMVYKALPTTCSNACSIAQNLPLTVEKGVKFQLTIPGSTLMMMFNKLSVQVALWCVSTAGNTLFVKCRSFVHNTSTKTSFSWGVVSEIGCVRN